MKFALICFTFVVLLQAVQSASFISSDRTKVKPDSDCQACESVMKFIRFHTLKQAQPVDAVKEKLKVLFKTIPFSVQNKEYLSNIEEYLKKIRNGMDPQSICKSMSKCSSEELEQPRITKCQVCTAVVDLIKFELMVSNATIQIIIKVVEEMCAILGDVPVYEECKLILGDINQIIQWIEQKITPEDICVKLELCNSTISILKTLLSDYKTLRVGNKTSVLCEICTMVLGMVENKLAAVEERLDKLNNELDDVCEALEDVVPQCNNVVDEIMSTIIQFLKSAEDKLDPEKACKAMHVCPSSLTNV